MKFLGLYLRHNLPRIALAATFVVMFSGGAFAETLEEYRTQLIDAKDVATELVEYCFEVENDTDRDVEYEKELRSELLEALPATVKVEQAEMTVETDNSWLAAALDAFQKEKNAGERRKYAVAIYERIEAIEAKVTPGGTVSPGPSKDEEKRRLAEILRRAEFQKPEEKEESWFQKFQRKLAEWLSEKMPKPPSLPSGAGQGLASVSYFMQFVLYAVVLGFIAFLIYRFAPFLSDRFKRRERRSREDRVVLGERIADDADSKSLLDEADALARSGNLRAAIRKGYIAFLCELSDRSIIGLAQHKTNRDYLRDVRKRDGLFRGMRGLTDRFERHWYGFESADEAAWNEFKRLYHDSLGGEK